MNIPTCATALLAGLLFFSSGCSGDGACAPDLSGTATNDFNVCYDTIRIERLSDSNGPKTLTIRYVKMINTQEEFPVKVVARYPLETGKDIALPDSAVSRTVNPPINFPEMESGIIRFSALGDVGETTTGEFAITFSAGNGTINGSFSGTMVEVGF